jgi:hypothetical protein
VVFAQLTLGKACLATHDGVTQRLHEALFNILQGNGGTLAGICGLCIGLIGIGVKATASIAVNRYNLATTCKGQCHSDK